MDILVKRPILLYYFIARNKIKVDSKRGIECGKDLVRQIEKSDQVRKEGRQETVPSLVINAWDWA